MSLPRDSMDFLRINETWRDLYTSAPDTAQHKDLRDFPPSNRVSIADQDSFLSSIPELKIPGSIHGEPIQLDSHSVWSNRFSSVPPLALAAHHRRRRRILALARGKRTFEGNIEYFVDPLDRSDLQ